MSVLDVSKVTIAASMQSIAISTAKDVRPRAISGFFYGFVF